MDVISSYYTVEGKQYAMPFNVSTPMLYYNKDVFEAAGLDPETPPTTYDEVLEDAKKIVESGAAPVGYSQAIYGWFFEIMTMDVQRQLQLLILIPTAAD